MGTSVGIMEGGAAGAAVGGACAGGWTMASAAFAGVDCDSIAVQRATLKGTAVGAAGGSVGAGGFIMGGACYYAALPANCERQINWI